MELVELNSFPRKALTSILYEAGPTALQHAHLRASDIMLKGMWARFVLQLFRSTKPDYNWSNSMILFLNVVNGALLLHSEDHTILRFCLASLLTAASKFSSIFKRDGYQMIVPTLVQVYALHMHNKLVTNALKFTWCQLYVLDSNFFLLQAIAATAILLSEEASILSSNVSSTYAGFPQSTQTMEGEVAQRHHAKAVFELLEALDEELPPDELEILVSHTKLISCPLDSCPCWSGQVTCVKSVFSMQPQCFHPILASLRMLSGGFGTLYVHISQLRAFSKLWTPLVPCCPDKRGSTVPSNISS